MLSGCLAPTAGGARFGRGRIGRTLDPVKRWLKKVVWWLAWRGIPPERKA
jgi:hypothetical protein